MASTSLLSARLGLAEAITTAARAQRDEARKRGDKSLYEGCCAALARREAEAEALRERLAAA